MRNVKSLFHINFPTQKWDEMVDFYVNVCGFDQAFVIYSADMKKMFCPGTIRSRRSPISASAPIPISSCGTRAWKRSGRSIRNPTLRSTISLC